MSQLAQAAAAQGALLRLAAAQLRHPSRWSQEDLEDTAQQLADAAADVHPTGQPLACCRRHGEHDGTVPPSPIRATVGAPRPV